MQIQQALWITEPNLLDEVCEKPETMPSGSTLCNLQSTAFSQMPADPFSDEAGFYVYLFVSVSFHSAQSDTGPG